jgi:hypothetical protein
MRGSSTLPGVVAEASLYHRPEKADERADMVGERWDICGGGGGTREDYRRERNV